MSPAFQSSTFSASPLNIRSMITRYKFGIAKPKILVFLSQAILLEPTCYTEAKGIHKWEQAMKVKFDALVKNNTWTIVPKPKNNKFIYSK